MLGVNRTREQGLPGERAPVGIPSHTRPSLESGWCLHLEAKRAGTFPITPETPGPSR